MGSPLDDALGEFDRREQQAKLEQEQRRTLRRRELRGFDDLVKDFCRRMAAAGNPGINWESNDGLFHPKVRGWSFTILGMVDEDDNWSTVDITTDGLISQRRRRGGSYDPAGRLDVPPLESHRCPGGDGQKKLAAGMAELMRRHGVR